MIICKKAVKELFMIYSELTKIAMNICCDAHAGQYDKSGFPYVFHPVHVAEQMETEYEICTALLHDVVEDTDVTLEELRAKGIPEEILEAVDLLTHRKNVPYLDYIREIKNNKLAAKVKLADLIHNSAPDRQPVMDAHTINRLDKYEKAKKILLEK